MEVRRSIALVRRWFWFLLLGTIIGGAIAFLVVRHRTPTYEATATILINQAQGDAGSTYTDVLANQQLSKTYGDLMRFGPILEQVAANLGLPPGSSERLRTMITAGVRQDTQLIDIRVRSSHPEETAAIANEVGKVFAEQIRQVQLGSGATLESNLTKQIAAVQASLDDRQQLTQQLSTPQAGLAETQRQQQLAQAQAELESLRQNLTDLQRRQDDLQLQLSKSINSVTLVNPAPVPTRPLATHQFLTMVLGAGLGLFVVSSIVAVTEQLDDTVKTADDIAGLGIASLGAIPQVDLPRMSRSVGTKAAVPLITSLDRRSPFTEAYRLVRTNLVFAAAAQPSQTLLVTSALSGEGKSFTAANLALALAETGRRVIVVDADLRRPSLHRMFGVSNVAGLSTLLGAERPALDEQLLRTTPMDNLLVLPSGPQLPSPAEALASPRMGEIIELLKAQADTIVVDSPPLLALADSATLAQWLDGALLLVDAGRTPRAAVSQAVEVLERARVTVWGAVLNRCRAKPAEGYYYSAGGAGDRDEAVAPTRPPVVATTVSHMLRRHRE